MLFYKKNSSNKNNQTMEEGQETQQERGPKRKPFPNLGGN